MKTKEFVEIFYNAVKISLETCGNEEIAKKAERFAKTCRFSFEEVTCQISDIINANFNQITESYHRKLSELVYNQSKRNSGQKLPWLSLDVVNITKQVLEYVHHEKIKNEGIEPKNQVEVTKDKPVVANGASKLGTSNFLSTVNDGSRFAKNDFSFDKKQFSEKEMSNLEFATNCCAFPKLALYLCHKRKVDPHFACRAINKTIENDATKASLTPDEVYKNFSLIK